jgi:hypothetical protein
MFFIYFVYDVYLNDGAALFISASIPMLNSNSSKLK